MSAIIQTFSRFSVSFVAVTLVMITIPLPSYAQEVSAATALARAALPRGENLDFGAAPEYSQAPLDDDVKTALDTAFGDLTQGWSEEQSAALQRIGESGDIRLGWVLLDLMRFVTDRALVDEISSALDALLQTKLRSLDTWHDATDRLIAWDIPAPPDYLAYKRQIFSWILPAWAPLFTPGTIDWRHVSWGGVRIDDRPYDQTDQRCNCIPAADNPKVLQAQDARWLADDAVVFGITLNGESRAYPRQIMEVREMVNDTLGGRNLGIPYCTLCGSAQAWFTDQLPPGVERPILRTSGMLIRSNKVMYDLNTYSVFDTFRGHAVNGPLADKAVALQQASVITTTWGAWKKANPETTVLAEELALGRDFDFRNNRDANGPIFPIGDVDPRLAVQEDVLGVVNAAGSPIAFHVPSLITALDAGEEVKVDSIRVVLDAGGVRAVDAQGQDLGTHQAFWFAWSQFYPNTRLWPDL